MVAINSYSVCLIASAIRCTIASVGTLDGQTPLDTPNRFFELPLATTPKNPFNRDLESYIQELMSKWKIPGMSIAVIDGDETFTKAYGYSTMPDIEATPETLYFTGSTSKAFTAATLAQLINSENFSALAKGWMTPISSIIRTDFVLHDVWSTANLNLEDAVSHRTGFPRHDLALPRYHVDGSKVTTAETVRILRNLKPSAPPRTIWQYSNMMYIVIGHVIETLTGKWLGDAIRETIWEPLGMKATFGDTNDAIAAPETLASGYYWNEGTSEYVRMSTESTRELHGAGLVISTVLDYSRWVRCLLDKQPPFSEEVHADLRRPRMLGGLLDPIGSGDSLYGLGWMKRVYHGEVVYKHSGETLSHATQVYWMPDLRFGVVAMANTGLADDAEDRVVWRIIEERLDVPKDRRYNGSSSLEEYMEYVNTRLQWISQMFYPRKPTNPLPSPLNSTQLSGKYFNEGYGHFDIFITEVKGITKLAANRTNMLFPYEMQFDHVTSNFWLIKNVHYDQHMVAALWAGEFKIGVDGSAAGIEIRFTPPGQATDDGTAWFEKLS